MNSLALVKYNPDKSLTAGHAETDISAVPVAIAVQHIHSVIACNIIAWQFR